MSLQVWLPLCNDDQNLDFSENKGLQGDIEVTQYSVIGLSGGKVGQQSSAFSNASGPSYITISKEAMTSLTTEASVCFWLKLNSWKSNYATFFQAGLGGAPWTHYIFGFLRNAANSTCCFTISNGSSSSSASYLTPELELNTWYHIGLIYKTGHCLIYINGQLYKDYSTSIVPNFSSITTITLGCCNTKTSYLTNSQMNDFRIYNHALSKKEVKEISKGLVLHYPLDQNLGLGLNLIKNGFGQLGTENWQSPGNRSTTEIPSGHSQIKASFFNNQTKQYIPINKDTTYKLQLYIKANPGSTSYMYPSIIPYDIDKKRINYQNCRIGFNLNTLTTLAQPLNPGDTKIYVTNLSNWNANSGHYYNYAAIFNYQDSTGHIYEVGEYTQNTPRFGNSTNAKTNLDKTNNIITLISSYTGPSMPIGTSICASTEGATYFYPFGALSGSNYQDWGYISKEFTPSLRTYLQVAKYIQFLTGWSHQYEAGIRITDLSTLDTIMSDDSGYLQNGTLNGTFENSMDTPRYSASQKFTGTNYVSLPSPCEEAKTVSLWVKWDAIPSGQSVVFVDYKSKIGFGLMSTGILCSVVRNSHTFSKANIVANTWYHFVIINPGTVTSENRKLYINGVEQTYTSSASNWTYSIDQLQLGKRSTTSDGFKGLISDFRMYSTVLNEEDILELYHTSAIADRNNNFYTLGNFIEDSSIKISHSGNLFSQAIDENPNYFAKIPKSHNAASYSAYQLTLLENLKEGETYTIELWNVDVSHSAKTASQLGVWIYWGGGSVALGSWSGTTYFTNGHADYLSKTFTVTHAQATGSGSANSWLVLYNSVGYVAGTMNMTVGKWKITKGGQETLSNKVYCKKDKTFHSNSFIQE